MKRIIPEFDFSEEQLNTVKRLAAECGLLEDTVKILYARGVDDKEKIMRFIRPSRKHFISPFKMSGMDEAVKLITRARDEEWSVVVYGDYDADGVCAAAVMCGALKDFGIRPAFYIPERRDGYGLNTAAIDAIFDEYFPQLFITVDCGISCAEQVEYIKEQGAEVIVTDHHELPDRLPDCICVNPKFNDGYIYDNLCGAGVALKVAAALNGEDALKYLDLAAIATVADSVPLTGENRDIVCEGLKIINANPRRCYAQFLNKTEADATAHTLAFGVAPKINAAGRMGDARCALDLFLSSDDNEIFNLSAKLAAYNMERQKYCDELYLSAKQKLKERGAYGKIIMLWDGDWNTGFVGIVAARLSDEFSRPAMLFVRNGDMLKGSARSVENINIYEALKACGEYIAEFGGHAQAAGVNIAAENFEKLEAALNAYLAARYSAEDFEPCAYVGGELRGRYSARFAKEIEMLEPFGVGNPRPQFVTEAGALDASPLKPLSPHLGVKSDNIELMYFNGVRYAYLLRSRAPKRFVFEYNISAFRGKEYVKGFIRDVVCPADAGGFCAEEIAVNNVLTLACPRAECDITYKTRGEIDAGIAEEGGYGTVYIASDYNTLAHYKNLKNYPAELFTLSETSLADAAIVSPLPDTDLSGCKRVVFLDSLPAGVRLASAAGKQVVICSDICGYNYVKTLPRTREQLLKIFAAVAANAPNLSGENSAYVALKNNLGAPAQIAFALEVFRELKLISYEGGALTVYRGVKTDLANSALYALVSSLEI